MAGRNPPVTDIGNEYYCSGGTNSRSSPISQFRTVHNLAKTSVSKRVTLIIAIVVKLCPLHLSPLTEFVFADPSFFDKFG